MLNEWDTFYNLWPSYKKSLQFTHSFVVSTKIPQIRSIHQTLLWATRNPARGSSPLHVYLDLHISRKGTSNLCTYSTMYKLRSHLVPRPVRTQRGLRGSLAQMGCVGRLASGKASQRNTWRPQRTRKLVRLPGAQEYSRQMDRLLQNLGHDPGWPSEMTGYKRAVLSTWQLLSQETPSDQPRAELTPGRAPPDFSWWRT